MEQLKVEVINDCYSQLRISGLTVDPTPEELETALTRLENMMAEFSARNICTEYNFEDEPDPNSLTNVDRYAWQMMATNLAIRLIPDFNKVVPPELKALANSSLSSASGVSARRITNQVQYPRRQARGSGSTLRYNRWQRFYRDQVPAPAACSTNYMQAGEIDDYTEHFDSYLNADETISSFTIESDPDITLVSSSNTGVDVNYRVEIVDNPDDSSTGYQQVRISVTTSDGRVEKRTVNFQLT